MIFVVMLVERSGLFFVASVMMGQNIRKSFSLSTLC